MMDLEVTPPGPVDVEIEVKPLFDIPIEQLEITPSAENQIFEGAFDKVTIIGDENLKAENILEGTSIFGVEGNVEILDTSDATATAEDISKDKTAYINGEKVSGTSGFNLEIDSTKSYSMKTSLQSMLVKAKDLDYTSVSCAQVFASFTKLEEVSFKAMATNKTDYYNMFQGCTKLKKVEGFSAPAGRVFQYMFQGCTSLEEAPQFDSSKAVDFSFMFNGCTSLREIPYYSKASTGFMAYGMKNMIVGCPNLSDKSLNNIMGMCSAYTNAEQKSLAYVGISAEQAERCKALSNYQTLVNKGWDMTGY